MPTALQESSEDRFRAIFGTRRSSGVSAPSQDVSGATSSVGQVLPSDRMLLVSVAPVQEPPNKLNFEPTPAGQRFRALLLRTGDTDFAGKVWNASAVVAFYLPREDDNGNEALRYIGTSTFLKYAGNDAGWFGMQNGSTFIIDMEGNEYDPHYLDPASTAQVCAWLRGQSDGASLALPMSAHGGSMPDM